MKKCILIITLLIASLTNSLAQPTWVWGHQGKRAQAEAYAVTTDKSGNVFGGGTIEAAGESAIFGAYVVPPSADGSRYQAIWVKYDSTGGVAWAGGTATGNTSLQAITTDPAGNLIVHGSFSTDTMQIGSFKLTNAYGSGSPQYFLAKISAAGSVLWAISDGNTVAAPDFTWGLIADGSIVTDDTGNIYIATTFSRATTNVGPYTLTNASSGYSDVLVAKYSPAGTALWARSFGGNRNDFAYGITISSAGYIYVAGDFQSSSFSVGASVLVNPSLAYQGFIAKFSLTGTPLWGERIGGPHNTSFASGLASDTSGHVYIVGSFEDTSVNFGTHQYHRPDTTDVGNAVFLAQYSPADTVNWVKMVEARYYGVLGFSVAWSPCTQSVWISGGDDTTLIIDGVDTLARPAGHDPLFIAGFSKSGTVVGYAGLGSGGDDRNAIACDAFGNVFVCGDFYANYSGISTLIIGNDTLTGTLDSEYLFVAKYRSDTTRCYCASTIVKANYTDTGATTVNFTYTGTTYYDSIKWDFGDGTGSYSTNPVHTYTASGVYHACVTIYSPCAFDGTDFTGFSVFCTDITVRGDTAKTGFSNVQDIGSITILPNPAASECTVSSSSAFPTGSLLELYDFTGRLVTTVDLLGNKTVIPLSLFAPGMYTCRINAGDKSVVKKLVIVR